MRAVSIVGFTGPICEDGLLDTADEPPRCTREGGGPGCMGPFCPGDTGEPSCPGRLGEPCCTTIRDAGSCAGGTICDDFKRPTEKSVCVKCGGGRRARLLLQCAFHSHTLCGSLLLCWRFALGACMLCALLNSMTRTLWHTTGGSLRS